ncbi:F420-dependent oxidoreductase [Actinomadura sp. CNU-125]|uniref:TIGR03621 family F420-dependent LLM class oxidoreductase n=1 Tax=Actinomadura sp. CNU-125 TaxID=1904961 RepID=UPI00095B15B8|nr:TIGR03621 family F420-dependent LLM class oxidoreductase [Actinomadura sp. CNU-125]OLT19123.1 F420-dependent oxidoreductase [Actinomadura sp. CNU-125]
MRDFRFSCNIFAIRSADGFTEYCRAAEEHGYDAIFSSDHFESPAPFSPLVAAAAATRRARVGTLVVNIGLWNPHVLAREVATADLLTGGRLELGVGVGHMRWEFDEAGLPWGRLDERVDRLESALDELEKIFGSGGYPQGEQVRTMFDFPALAPQQRHGLNGTGPPLIVGGMGDRMLDLAARRADTVSLSGLVPLAGEPGALRVATAAEADERIRFVRERAGGRADDIELHQLVQAVVVTDDRVGTAHRMVEQQMPFFTADELLETPFMLIGTVDEIAARIRDNADRFGFSCLTVLEPHMEAFAPVIGRFRGDT